MATDKAYNKTLIEIQKLANSSAKAIQDSVNKSNKQQMDYNKEEAKTARDWQERMTKTSHQMEVEDLKKAGLNPVLSSGGSGAQSYTTSSASTQNDSGASAKAAILEGQIGAMTNLESSRMSSEAQTKAANAQAAATRYAAAQQSAAAKYAASMQYQASKYRADTDNIINKRNVAAQKWISVNKQAGSIAGFADKYFSKIRDSAVKKGAKAFHQQMNTGLKTIGKNAQKYFSNKGKITQNNFKLNSAGQKYVNSLLKKNNIRVTTANRRLAVSAFVFRNQSSYNKFMTIYIVNHFRHGSKGTPRRGHL